jgi:ion channel-forming bestrophin family protein
MITYNPKDWFTLIFQFHRSDTFRILIPTMCLLGLFTAGVCYVESLHDWGEIPPLTVFHQISGFIISLVLVFRINSAYDRWWEGRKLWGSLVNNCRNLAIRMNAVLPEEKKNERQILTQLLGNFPFALKEHLREAKSTSDLQFNDELSEQDLAAARHRPNLIAARLTSYCMKLCEAHRRSENDYLVIAENLGSFTDIAGACERIRSTPIPYSYSIFIKKIIFLYIITMPFAFGLTIGYLSVPVVLIMFYAFASLELISEEIEDPFGTDSNDLPTDEISARIRANITEILTRP